MTLRFLTAGESHGPALVAILDGLPAGLALDEEPIQKDLARRQKGYGAGPRMKLEEDRARILSGVMGGVTTGAPISFLIENQDHARWKGKPVAPFVHPRPGHADLTGAVKFGLDDLRPALERASARETAARVAVGATCRAFLAAFGIRVGGYVCSIGEIEASLDGVPLPERIDRAFDSDVSCPDPQAGEAIHDRIRKCMEEKDTLGGVIEVVSLGLPAGLGSYTQWDRRLEACLGAAILSVQSVKGVEIGRAFDQARLPGTQVQDSIYLDGDTLARHSNRAGGLEGGVTNGQPLVIRAALKPIATTLTPLETVDLVRGEPTPTQYERSDFCPVPRAVVILEGMAAFVLAGALIEKLGGDSLAEMLPRFAALSQMKLGDIHLAGEERVWWPE
ncbi:MAG TPA: chorismate synthase [Anaerolineaceae bacterium]|nr:chorismate synthase [Anaerolineaceae bacterium]